MSAVQFVKPQIGMDELELLINQENQKNGSPLQNISKDECVEAWLADCLAKNGEEVYQQWLMRFLAENTWNFAGRPFFNCFPKLIECLSRTPLSIPLASIPKSVIHEIGSIQLRFDKATCDSLDCDSIILNYHEVPWPGYQVTWSSFPNERTTGEMEMVFGYMHFAAKDSLSSEQLNISEIQRKRISVVLGVLLLAADEENLTPVLLNRDIKAGKRGEGAARRARSRGVYGFNLGERFEKSPHIRRAHFAIRHTGKGRSVPKLVLINSTVVNRKYATEIPTGFDGRK